MLEGIVRGVRDNAAEAYGEREEALRHSGVPDGGIQEFRPDRSDEVVNPVDRTVQRHRANQQGD